MLLGGWTPYRCGISNEAKEVFEKIVPPVIGVDYELFACATQLVNGTNYSFFCNSRVVTSDPRYDGVIIDAHQPLEGPPYLIEKRVIHPFMHYK